MPRRVMKGVVVSAKSEKTAIVRVNRTFLHPVLKKTVRRSRKYHAHDESNGICEGQQVSIREIPPKSRLKRWEIIDAEAVKK